MKNVNLQRLVEIKDTLDKLYEEQQAILEKIDEQIIEQNEDGTWTRFNKVDNVKALIETGSFFKATSVNRYSADIKTLKNKPKELE